MRTAPLGPYAVRGLLAGVAGLLVAELADLALTIIGWPGSGSSGRSPVLAVGAAFVDLTPSWLKDWAVAAFGTADKAVLFAGMAIVLAAGFAATGLLTRRRHTWGVVAVAALGAVAGWALATRPSAALTDLLPTLLGMTVAIAVLTRSAALTPPALQPRLPGRPRPPCRPRGPPQARSQPQRGRRVAPPWPWPLGPPRSSPSSSRAAGASSGTPGRGRRGRRWRCRPAYRRRLPREQISR